MSIFKSVKPNCSPSSRPPQQTHTHTSTTQTEFQRSTQRTRGFAEVTLDLHLRFDRSGAARTHKFRKFPAVPILLLWWVITNTKSSDEFKKRARRVFFASMHELQVFFVSKESRGGGLLHDFGPQNFWSISTSLTKTLLKSLTERFWVFKSLCKSIVSFEPCICWERTRNPAMSFKKRARRDFGSQNFWSISASLSLSDMDLPNQLAYRLSVSRRTYAESESSCWVWV